MSFVDGIQKIHDCSLLNIYSETGYYMIALSWLVVQYCIVPEINRPSPETVSNDPTGLARIFRALRYRNYRLFFIGQGISLIGTWMQQVAMSWLVYSLTNSAFLLGVVAFSGLICTFLMTPFAGVLVDRLDRHRILVVTQTLAMLQAFALAAVVLTGTAAVWNLVPAEHGAGTHQCLRHAHPPVICTGHGYQP